MSFEPPEPKQNQKAQASLCLYVAYVDWNTLNKIEICLRNICIHKWKEIEKTDEFWLEVHSFRDSLGENPFIELSSFVLRLLSLPYSNAEVERTFSLMNIVKTKIRNRLSLNSVNALLHIKYGLRIENTCCSTFNLPSEVCKKLIVMKLTKNPNIL